MAETTDDRLRLLIERVERLEEEKKGIADDIKDVYAEAKAVGYDVKMMREIVRLRKMHPDDRREMELILDTYKCALGLDSGYAQARAPQSYEPTPLEKAIAQATGKPIDMVKLAVSIQEKGGRVEQRDGECVLVLPMTVDAPQACEQGGYDAAVQIVTEERKASASFLQRRLALGYNTAAGFIERMEKAGIVGPPDHVGRREVLAPASV